MPTIITETKTTLLWREHQQQWDARYKAMAAQVAAEFPKGTKVRWVHTYERGESRTPIYRVGLVDEVHDSTVYIRMRPGGPKHSIAAHLLDIVKDD